MRRFGVITLALLLLALLGMPAPPAQAQAPAPKVTLGGTFDVATSAHWNWSQIDADFTRNSDSAWLSRQRTTLVALGEVDKARGVLAFEIDLGWGMTGPGMSNTSGTAGAQAPQLAFITGTGMGASNDNLNAIEIKQMYVQFPVPLAPAPTTLRLGGQPGVGTLTYKPTIWIDDFPGVYFTTTFTPAVKTHFFYAQFDEDATGCVRPRPGNEARDASGSCNTRGFLFSTATGAATLTRTTFQRGDDFVIGLSFDVTPWKGFDVRPFYTYWTQKGAFQNTQNTQLPPTGQAGIATGTAFASDQAKREYNYFGLDSRWRSGPFSFDPTVIYLYGQNDLACPGVAAKAGGCGQLTGATTGQDIRAWMVDLRGGWRTGPLLLEGLFIYVPGNDARDNMGNTAGAIHDQNYFTPINTGGGYAAGWSNFLTSNQIDFIRGAAIGTSISRGSFISFDRYGTINAAFKPSYALTRALTLSGLIGGNWTAEEVDTHGVFVGATGHTPETQGDRRDGDDRYLGTEVAAGLTWAFAPGLTFDWGVAHLFAGDAYNQCKTSLVAGACRTAERDARDATSVAARVRFAF